MIRLQHVSKSYGGRPALKDINLHVALGEFAFLVGPSGAGKSTMMRLLYREEVPTSGSVFIGGVNLNRLSPRQIPLLRRRLGIIFQDYKLLTRQTAFDNVAYILRALGVDEKDVRKRVTSALNVVNLEDKADAFPDELSGGEQQRVGIARAIVNGPPVLLADEPTGNLDPATSLEIVQLLSRISERGTTVLISTHDHTIVDAMRRRVIALKNGELFSDVDSGVYDMDLTAV
ncbi:cell division ATP-binding protein FtsE [Candidatus Obscuribacterales bacterium]|jgi:cell division transport system ATP-binding protein|nr:cell division ATP-binding protein FtsE [Candidatus Obscuribacterales bacterium]MBX3138836.1 cell division ATP-binding protein FtsE [Candidatus Obscuribacterales bacterium]MBX3149167.1 cell division ATP-binding protein FtsE [Candidatus Obscuribacterales bacterium]